MINVSATATLPMNAELLGALTLVGQHVTYQDGQYTVHCVEGDDWYAFAQDGQVTVDTNMTARWLKGVAQATIIPAGHRVGDGHSATVPLAWLRRGVSLVHPYRQEW